MKIALFAADVADGGWPQDPALVVERLPVPRVGEHVALPGDDDRATATVVAVEWHLGGADPGAAVLAYYDPQFTPAPTTVTITDQDAREIRSALEDAADYRRDQGESCSGCDEIEGPGKCGDHETDDAMASMYDMLAETLLAKLARIGQAGDPDLTGRVDG